MKRSFKAIDIMGKIKFGKTFYLQAFFVVLIFVAMVSISIIYTTTIIKEQIQLLGNETIAKAAVDVNSFYTGTEMTLDGISCTVLDAVNNGATQAEVKNMFVSFSKWLATSNDKFENFSGVYGFIRNEYIDGADWIPPDDYVPTERPWYTGAMLEPNKVSFSVPYMDADTQKMVVTVSRQLHDKNNDFIGVIAFDVEMSKIIDYVNNLKFIDNGYGVLISSDLSILAHICPEFTEVNLHDTDALPPALISLANGLKISKNISGMRFTDYNGVESIAFFRDFFDTWAIGVILPIENYYEPATAMLWSLSFIGLILMSMLLYILGLLSFKNQLYANQLTEKAAQVMQYKNLANTDALTGIQNRNAYNAMALFCQIDLDIYSSFAIAVFDLNNLKDVNDNFGHDCGDEYIKISSKLICDSFPTSHVYRIGGDEFVAILIDISEAQIKSEHAALLKALNKYNKTSTFNAAIAFGYEFYNKKKVKTFDEVFRMADEKMYKNKQKLKDLT